MTHERHRAVRIVSLCVVLRLLSLAALSSAAGALLPRRTDVVVSVSSPKAEPIEGAAVAIATLGLTASTDWIGEGHLRQVPNGRYRLEVRRLGFAPSSVDINVSGDTVGVFVVLEPVVHALDTLRVITAGPVQWNLQAFERRRAMGFGRFLDDSLLQQQGAANLSMVLSQQLPGLWAVADASRPGFYKLLSRRSTNSLRPGEGECGVDVYLDGARYYEDVDAIRPVDLAAVELYSTGSAPVEYRPGTASCHVLLLWLKFGDRVRR